MANKREDGKTGEKKAKEYLINLGYIFITENWRNRFGEIDLIMTDCEEIVFVEVRTKSNIKYGSGIESINIKKQQQLVKMAAVFLQYKGWWDRSYRIDIVALDKKNNFYNLIHIKNAIEI